MQITKAVFPVAGFGTRFLPATKASPKEMLPIIDKPIIQYAVEEAIQAGVKSLIFITSNEKRAIEDHFDRNHQLESHLIEKEQYALLESINSIIPQGVHCIYLRQHQMLGLGHAILCAKPVIGKEPFIVSLADDLIYNEGPSCLEQMMNIYNDTGKSVIAAQQVPESQCNRYGIIKHDSINRSDANKIDSIIEKPNLKDAPSNIAAVGRYIFTNEILNILEQTSINRKEEMQVTPAIDALAKSDIVYSLQFKGKRYDCGDKLGYLKAVFDYSAQHPVFGDSFKKYVKHQLFS
jgi:UTP--glucose-1-phosphate uridylyltransferase